MKEVKHTHTHTHSETAILCFIYFIAISVLSVYFYKERVAFLDTAYHLFEILRTGTFAIQNHRFVGFFTQLPVVLGTKLSIDLYWLSHIYNVAFACIPIATIFVVHKVTRDQRWIYFYLIFSTLIYSHLFFWPLTELSQGIAAATVYFALLFKKSTSSWVNTIILPLLAFMVAFSSPLMIFFIGFSHIFLWLSSEDEKSEIIRSFVLLLSFSVIKHFLFATAYESSAAGNLIKNFTSLESIFLNEANANFLNACKGIYILLPITFIGCELFYFYKKQYFKIGLLALSIPGIILLINLNYARGIDLFYIENQYQLAAGFMALPFAFDILPAMGSKLRLSLLLVVCIISIVRILYISESYTERYQWIEKKSDELITNGEKVICRKCDFPKDLVKMDWALTYEVWLVSTLKHQQSASAVQEINQGEFDWIKGANNKLITNWGVFDYSDLPNEYFRFSDKVGYQVVGDF